MPAIQSLSIGSLTATGYFKAAVIIWAAPSVFNRNRGQNENNSSKEADAGQSVKNCQEPGRPIRVFTQAPERFYYFM